MSAAAAATAAAAQVIPKAFPKRFHKYVGNGHFFQRLIPYEKYFFVRFFNSVYDVPPLFKWSLSIVPLCGIVTGNPPVEKIDFNSSLALTATGLVWFVYALLITPQNSGSRSLAAVNFCLAIVNGYNCYRYASHKPVVQQIAS